MSRLEIVDLDFAPGTLRITEHAYGHLESTIAESESIRTRCIRCRFEGSGRVLYRYFIDGSTDKAKLLDNYVKNHSMLV